MSLFNDPNPTFFDIPLHSTNFGDSSTVILMGVKAGLIQVDITRESPKGLPTIYTGHLTILPLDCKTLTSYHFSEEHVINILKDNLQKEVEKLRSTLESLESFLK